MDIIVFQNRVGDLTAHAGHKFFKAPLNQISVLIEHITPSSDFDDTR